MTLVKERTKSMKPTIQSLKSIENDTMYTLDEAAALCGVTAAGIRQWSLKGHVKFIRVGSRFYVTGAELKKAIDV